MSFVPGLRRAIAPAVTILFLASALYAQTVPHPVAAPASNTTVERALATRTTWKLPKLTIAELAEEVHQRFRINVLVDQQALDDVGLDANTSGGGINCANIQLENTLELILDQFDLSFYIRHDVLIITTPEVVENHLDTVVYPVADLVVSVPVQTYAKHIAWADFDTLIEAITSAVAPDTWDEVGGAGAIEPYPSSGALVISQTRVVHRQVQALLTQLRQAKTVQHLDTKYSATSAGSEAIGYHATPHEPPRHMYRPSGAWSVPRTHD